MKETSIKNRINKAIKWTSSKFNEYKKAEVVERILRMKPFTWQQFECGTYSEKSWCVGYHYTVHRTKEHINIFDTVTRICIASIKVTDQ